MPTLNHFDPQEFLRSYWQQQPLLIRGALPHFQNPLSPEELAGLACEAEVESRIIIENHGQFQLKQGPFDDSDFAALPPTHWTLLVQAVDHWVAPVSNLLNYFRFIPNWRVDDVMVSYASSAGNAGPHYDAFSVFLIQGLGQRRWQVGNKCNSHSALQNNEQLRLLANFEAVHDWVLEPGDILYLPPGYAHWGVAVSEHCMTYSVGFRAPSYAEILSNYCDYQLEQLDHLQRYDDPRISEQLWPGEITEATIDTIQTILMQQLSDKNRIARWFGSYMTEPKYPPIDNNDVDSFKFDDIRQQIIEHGPLLRNSSARFAFTRTADGGILFVNGEQFHCCCAVLPLAERLSSFDSFQSSDILKLINCEHTRQLLTTLFNRGYFYCNDQLHN